MAATQTRLALKKGRNLYILFRLMLNGLLRLRLRLHKWVHGIKRPIVHYYAVCWNEEAMLPFVLDHYAPFVDEFYFYDNGSTDGSRQLIAAHPRAHVVGYTTPDGFNDTSNMQIKNSCWKRSRGKADYVVVCDVDELLYHLDMPRALQALVRDRVSLATTEGYEMYHEAFPRYPDDCPLAQHVRRGVRSHWLDKQLLFDPHLIVDINFDEGAHNVHPWGVVRRGAMPFKVLHYKHLGADYLLARYNALAQRLSAHNRAHRLGLHYLATRQEIVAELEQGLAEAQPVV